MQRKSSKNNTHALTLTSDLFKDPFGVIVNQLLSADPLTQQTILTLRLVNKKLYQWSEPELDKYFKLKKIEKIYTGGNRSFFLTKGGLLFACGENSDGELGLGHTDKVITLVKVEALEGQVITQIITGLAHTFCVTKSGVYAWGNNVYGQLGLGYKNREVIIPTKVEALEGQVITDIAVGTYHTLCLTKSGDVYACGNNLDGQLGLVAMGIATNLTKVNAFKDQKVVRIIAGSSHTLYLTEAGDLYACGVNSNGQLGLGHKNNVATPTKVEALENQVITDIAASYHHTLCLTKSGDLYAWGDNSDGQLGLGNIGWTTLPIKVEVLKGQKIIAGWNHTFGLTNDGKIYAWGDNKNGELGLGHNAKIVIPTEVEALKNKTITKIITTHRHAFGLTNDGKIYAWGDNYHGQLGLGHKNNVATPTKLTLNITTSPIKHFGLFGVNKNNDWLTHFKQFLFAGNDVFETAWKLLGKYSGHTSKLPSALKRAVKFQWDNHHGATVADIAEKFKQAQNNNLSAEEKLRAFLSAIYKEIDVNKLNSQGTLFKILSVIEYCVFGNDKLPQQQTFAKK